MSIFHVNVGDASSEPGSQVINRLRRPERVLIIGGGIRTSEQAREVIAAGADAVAVATAAMKDPQLCGRMQAELQESC